MSEEGLIYQVMHWASESVGRLLFFSLGMSLVIVTVVWIAAGAINDMQATYDTQVHGEPSPPECKVIRYRLGYDAACAIECRRGQHRWSTPVPCEHMGKQVRREFVP